MLKKRNLVPELNRPALATLVVHRAGDQHPITMSDCRIISLLDQPSSVVNDQLKQSLAGELRPVIKIDEGDQRLAPLDFANQISRGLTNSLSGISAAEVAQLTIVYAPQWAADYRLPADAQRIRIAHRQIRDLFQAMFNQEIARHVQIIYGGFAFENEYADLLCDTNVDGVLTK